jgi:hypothetical protein
VHPRTYAQPMLSPDRLAVTPEVADALRDGRPVVVLESTLITHGFAYPRNIEVATASEAAVAQGVGDLGGDGEAVRAEHGLSVRPRCAACIRR